MAPKRGKRRMSDADRARLQANRVQSAAQQSSSVVIQRYYIAGFMSTDAAWYALQGMICWICASNVACVAHLVLQEWRGVSRLWKEAVDMSPGWLALRLCHADIQHLVEGSNMGWDLLWADGLNRAALVQDLWERSVQALERFKELGYWTETMADNTIDDLCICRSHAEDDMYPGMVSYCSNEPDACSCGTISGLPCFLLREAMRKV